MSVGALSRRAWAPASALLGLRLSPLERVRRLFLVSAYVSIAVYVFMLLVDPRPGPYAVPTGLLGVSVVAGSLWVSRRGPHAGPMWLLDSIGLLLAALALSDPNRAIGIMFGSMFFRAQYGSARRLACQVLGGLSAMVLATVLVAGVPGVLSPDTLPSLVGLPVLAALMHGSKLAMLRYEEGRQRDRALLDASNALVSAVGPEQIAGVAAGAAAALVADPSARVALLVGPAGHADRWAGDVDPVALPEPVLAAIAEGRVVAAPCAEHETDVLTVPLLVHGRSGGALVVATARPVPAPQAETLASLANAVALALESSSLAEDLHARRGEARFAALVHHASDAIVILNSRGAVAYHSPATERLLGYPGDALAGAAWAGLLNPDDAPQFRAVYEALLATPGDTVQLRVRVRHSGGSWRHVETSATNLLQEPHVRGVVLINRDITDQVELEEQLAHRAYHDPLTGLANRALFLDRLGHALARSGRTGSSLSVVLVDLDDFKTVNDSLGHSAGDRLLIEVADRLRAVMRSADTIARIGGDEFALMIEDAGGDEKAIAVAERITETLRAPFRIGVRELVLGGSLGIVPAGPGDDVEELISNADLAMYQAKAKGKGRYEIYHHELQQALTARLELTGELHHALERAEFVPFYQPIVSLVTGEIIGMEALLRWRHPERGMVSPAEFIPLAEETGLIVPIGQWVLESACAQAARWSAEHGRPLSMSVNLSARQLQDPDLAGHVAAALRQHGLPGPSLTLEITESLLMHDTTATIAKLDELKQIGVRLAVDDFGTGYSSLGYLRRFPIDVLKIDKCFIDGIAGTAEDAMIGRTIVKLGQTLRLVTVAEGIEHAEQADQLSQLGCDLGQGFHFARPMPADDVVALLRKQWSAALAGS